MVLVLTVVHLKEVIVKFLCEIKLTIRNNTTRRMIKLLRSDDHRSIHDGVHLCCNISSVCSHIAYLLFELPRNAR